MRVSTCLKLIVLGLLLIALGIALRVGVGLWRYHTSPEQLHALLYEQLTGALDAEVELGPVSLNREGLLCAEDLAIRLPGRPEPLFACRKVLIGLDKVQALRLRLVVEKVTVVEPRLNLSYSPTENRWNVEELRVKPGAGAEAPSGLLREGIVLEDGTVTVRSEPLFGDEAPRTYEGLHLVLQPERGMRVWHAEGGLHGGRLSGTRLAGWVRAGPDSEFNLDVTSGRLQADEALWHLIPQGRTVWGDFAVRGLLACRGTVCQRSGEGVRFNFRVDVIKAALRTPFYPVGLTDAHGLVHITEQDLVVQGCTGAIPPDDLDASPPDAPPAQVRVSGSTSLSGGGGTFCIEALDLPLGRKTITGIPEAGPEIWRRLAPRGQARLLLTVCERPGPEPTSFAATVDLADATLNPPEFPLPLQRVGGTLVVTGQTVRLNNLTGLIVQDGDAPDSAPSAASFALDGLLDLRGESTRLKLTLDNLRANEELVKAVPGVGAGVWEMFRPEVVLDVTALLSDSPDKDEMSATVLLDLHGGTARPDFLPMPLHDICGSIRVEDGKVFLERITAVIDTDGASEDATGGRSVVELHGVVVPESEVADVYVTAGNLTLTESILSAVPTVGARVWEEARPKGTVSVSGRVRYDPQREIPVRFLLDVALQDVSVLPRFLPIPVDALAGRFLLTEEQAISNDFSGVTCGGQFQGAVVAYYGEGVELPSYGAQLQFSQVELGALIEALTGKETDITGRLTGALALGGLAGDEVSTAGKGTVALSEGRLWETPFFARMLSVLRLSAPPGDEATSRGEVSLVLSGDMIRVRNFELTGSGLNLTGFGEVMLDGRLDLTMVAIGAPEKGGIPIVTPIMGWLLQFVERELVKLHVTGPIADPDFEATVLGKIASPLIALPRALLSPLLGRGSAEPAER